MLLQSGFVGAWSGGFRSGGSRGPAPQGGGSGTYGLIPSRFCQLNTAGIQVLHAGGHWWRVSYHRLVMSGYVYRVEIVNLSGATLASFQVQGDDTMRNVLLRRFSLAALSYRRLVSKVGFT